MATTTHKPGIINCHAHVLTNRVMPNQLFLYPLPIVPLLRIRALNRFLLGLLGFLGRLGSKKLERRLERVIFVVKMSTHNQQQQIFTELSGYYSPRTSFVLLSLDTEFMGKGRAPQEFEHQLEDLLQVRQQNPGRVYPFLAIDPRRKWSKDKVEEYLNRGFCGIKLYPPHGFKPYDESYKQTYPDLLDIYAYLQDNQIPIIAHCTPDGLRGKKFEEDHKKFADPDIYKQLLDQYPELKLCLAHFGGITEWDKYLNNPWELGTQPAWVSKIRDMIMLNEKGEPKYPNLYTDISYTAYNVQTHAFLKVLLANDRIRTRVLFGSDYYVVEVEATERAFSIGLRGYLGEGLFDQIARVNPRQFLVSSVLTDIP